jgi:hypothetical protein
MVGQWQRVLKAFQPFGNPIAVRRYATVVGGKAENKKPYYFQYLDFHYIKSL